MFGAPEADVIEEVEARPIDQVVTSRSSKCKFGYSSSPRSK